MAQQRPSAAGRVAVIAFMGMGSVAMLLIGIGGSPPAEKTGFALVTVGFIMVGFVAGGLYGGWVNRNRGRARSLRPSTTAGRLKPLYFSLAAILGIYTTGAFVHDTGYLTFLATLASAITGLMTALRLPTPPNKEGE